MTNHSDNNELDFYKRSLEELQIELVLQNQRLAKTAHTPESVLWEDICGAILRESDPEKQEAMYTSLDEPLRAAIRTSIVVRARAILTAAHMARAALEFLGETEWYATGPDVDKEYGL